MDIILETIALAGGGGSSSGGGGGGGGGSSFSGGSSSSSGGSSGDGDPLIVPFMILGGFFIYFMVRIISKLLSARGGTLGALGIGIIATILIGILNIGYAFSLAFGGIFGLIIASAKSSSAFIDRAKIKKKLKISKSKDPAWDEEMIAQRAKEVFINYQNDWSKFDYESIKKYTTNKYFAHASLMLIGLQQMGRRNNVVDPKVAEAYITDAYDSPEDSKDRVEVYFRASATDVLLDIKQESTLYSNKVNFQEFWTFNRQGNRWVLDGISQQTASLSMQNQSLVEFAEKNKMFYSLDWGGLLLPTRGLLFGKANFKYSDINNHVIGEKDSLLMQLYTYIPVSARKAVDNYLIAQINLPKSYGGILVNRKSKLSLFGRTPQGYQKISFEWPDFNKRYRVFATDMDKVTSFELLNPKFMADLYDKDIKVDIEVVDNTVYLYSKVSAGENRYEEMLEILQQAFDELKR